MPGRPPPGGFPIVYDCPECGATDDGLVQETVDDHASCACGWQSDLDHTVYDEPEPEDEIPERLREPEVIVSADVPADTIFVISQSPIPESDPELERLLREEEEIERDLHAATPQRGTSLPLFGVENTYLACPNCQVAVAYQWQRDYRRDAYTCLNCGTAVTGQVLRTRRERASAQAIASDAINRIRDQRLSEVNRVLFVDRPSFAAAPASPDPGPVPGSCRQDGSVPGGYDLRRNLP